MSTLAAVMLLCAAPASAAYISIISITGPNGLAAGASGNTTDGLTWSGLGASVTSNDLALYGSFFCSATCTDFFDIQFIAGTETKYNVAQLSAVGTANGQAFNLFANSRETNQSLGFLQVGNTGLSFNVQSTPSFFSGGNFSGDLILELMMTSGGRITFPSGSTADLFLNSAPEPATLAIAAACIALLVYVKRLRKA
jgi:hypothetical protein